MLLLNTQRNDVFLAIREAGLDPGAFTWTEVRSQFGAYRVSFIEHTKSGYYFTFDMKGTNHYARFSPGEGTEIESQYPGYWGGQLAYFRAWLGYLKREIDAPDLWGALKQSPELAVSAAEPLNPNVPFGVQEQEHIRKLMGELAAFLKASHSVTGDRLTRVEAQLDYLVDASARSSRRDWSLMALGTVVNVITASALPPDVTSTLLQMTGAGLRWLFQGSPFLPTPLS